MKLFSVIILSVDNTLGSYENRETLNSYVYSYVRGQMFEYESRRFAGS